MYLQPILGLYGITAISQTKLTYCIKDPVGYRELYYRIPTASTPLFEHTLPPRLLVKTQ